MLRELGRAHEEQWIHGGHKRRRRGHAESGEGDRRRAHGRAELPHRPRRRLRVRGSRTRGPGQEGARREAEGDWVGGPGHARGFARDGDGRTQGCVRGSGIRSSGEGLALLEEIEERAENAGSKTTGREVRTENDGPKTTGDF